MKTKSLYGLAVLLLFGCKVMRNEFSNPEITQPELKYHITFLASDSLKGRGSGTEGNNIAAHYLSAEFESYGLRPMGSEKGFFQPFEVITGVHAGEHNMLVCGDRPYQIEKEFRPLSFSSDTLLEGPLVLAGYGISAPDLKYDDYENVDVKDKIVMIMRNGPDGDNPHSGFYDYAPSRRKVSLAAEKGAKGVLIFTGIEDGEDELLPLSHDLTTSRYGIPVVSVVRKTAMDILGFSDSQLQDYQKKINSSKKPASVVTSAHVKIQTEIVFERRQTQNVIGFLEGSDNDLKKEIVILGAHYDHLGMGGPGSLYHGVPAIHNGADDNASGTAAILELAQKLSTEKLKRSVLVIGFSAEELGTIGSKYFAEHPTVDLKNAVTMINLDMVGRLKDNKLIVYGMGTSPGFTGLFNEVNKTYSFDLSLKPDGNGPSDFATFYQKDMPVISFFTNLHEDYHKPTDDVDKINFEGEERVTKMALDVLVRLANEDKRPVFTKVKEDSSRKSTGFRASLGIVPNYADNVEGLKIDDVNPGQAGDLAGIKKGDVIIKFGGKTIKSIYDYTYALGEYKGGDKVEIIVKRGDKEVKLEAVLQKSKRMN